VEVIPYGLPLDIYTPVDRVLARTALGIKPGGPVVLVVAQKLAGRRKGGTILIEALQRVCQRPLTLVTLGHGHLPRAVEGVTLHALGYIDHERTKVLAYAAADVLVHPAPVDNLPNVVMEAMACGTPCVGFAIGGVPDMVQPGKTGWLAHQVTAQALASAIDTALKDIKQGKDLRVSCRSIAETEYDEAIQAQRYLTLFKQLHVSTASHSPLPGTCYPLAP
jgi:glycosyltransferase involved in cell wall biosynthesis